jgi:hypothetical protein
MMEFTTRHTYIRTYAFVRSRTRCALPLPSSKCFKKLNERRFVIYNNNTLHFTLYFATRRTTTGKDARHIHPLEYTRNDAHRRRAVRSFRDDDDDDDANDVVKCNETRHPRGGATNNRWTLVVLRSVRWTRPRSRRRSKTELW